MKLALVTTENFFDGEAQALNLLFADGLRLLHLRKPNATRKQTAQLLEAIEKPFHQYIVLHDYFELTEDFSLKGVHLNRRNDAVPVDFRGSVSRSCHSLKELEQYAKYDYLFLSPIFDSISKAGYPSAFSEQELAEAQKNGVINERIFALGGVNVENIPAIKRWGFGGAAVLGTLWGDFPESHEVEKLMARWRRLKEKRQENDKNCK